MFGFLLVVAQLHAPHPLPASASRGFVWIEARCSGGIAGRTRIVRIAADGTLTRTTTRGVPPAPAGRLSAGEARALSDRLDAAGFDTLATRPEKHHVYDGVNCSIERSGARNHDVTFLAGAGPANGALAAREAKVSAVMYAIFDAANRVSLNPQPIPPGGAMKHGPGSTPIGAAANRLRR